VVGVIVGSGVGVGGGGRCARKVIAAFEDASPGAICWSKLISTGPSGVKSEGQPTLARHSPGVA
jgi:hypothetical protein